MERFNLRENFLRLSILALILFSTICMAGSNFDNIRINGNTFSTLNTNGDFTFDANGTGRPLFTDLTATTVPYLDAAKRLQSSAVTPTQLGYVDFTSSGQTQLNSKQATGNYVTALTGDVTAAGPGSVAATIANDAVTNAKAANMADSTIKGRAVGAGTGDGTDLTATQATEILNAMVGDSGSGGTKGLAPAPGSGDAAAGKFLKADGTYAVPAAGTPTFAYRSVTTTDSPTTSDNTLVCSGNSFTITLPTAVGHNHIFDFAHNDTSLTKVYTFNTTSSQTIGGLASGVVKMYTNGEKFRFQSDGANWIILNHYAKTAQVNTGTFQIIGTSTDPVYGTATIPVNQLIWSRDGKFADIEWNFQLTVSGTATAGTGDYKFPMPTNLTIDNTLITYFTTVIGADALSNVSNTLGDVWGRSDATAAENFKGAVVAFDTNFVRFMIISDGAGGAGRAGAVSAVKTTLSDAPVSFYGRARVPITGWLQ